MKRIVFFNICIIVVIFLTGCNLSSNYEEISKYKENAKNKIYESITLEEKEFTEEDWNLISSYINNALTKINDSQSEHEIDKIVYETKKIIIDIQSNYPINEYVKIPGEQQFTNGEGTKENPYVIDSKEKMIYFSNCINSGIGNDLYYELKSNIDLSYIDWIPVGYSLYNGFSGHFNGNGYEIINCEFIQIIKNIDIDTLGIFGYNSGIIENVGIINININVDWYYEPENITSLYSGGIVGFNDGFIDNCYSFGEINLKYYGGRYDSVAPVNICSGGIAAVNNGIISNSYTKINLNIEFFDKIGTVYIAGIAVNGTIENCLAIFNKEINYLGSNYLDNVKDCGIGGNNIINSYMYRLDEKIKDSTCSFKDLNSNEFYIDKLKWSITKWNFNNIIFEYDNYFKNSYPKLNNE